jgi:AraC-like DNA-binding protein
MPPSTPSARRHCCSSRPYQRIRIVPARRVRGTLIRFHANFLCVETFHAESGCSGLLFNDPFGSPALPLDEETKVIMPGVISAIEREHAERQLGYNEAIVARLKLLLIAATRLKAAAGGARPAHTADLRHPLLAAFRELVEAHYRGVHAPSAYAALLHVTPKTLNRVVRAQLGKTVSQVIRERMLVHAKWELLHTLRPVKEVAAELGFDDELYFSRLFKKATGVSPVHFREFETAIRGGSNLSMPLSRPPIPPRPPAAEDATMSRPAGRAQGGHDEHRATVRTGGGSRSPGGGGHANRAGRRAGLDRRPEGRKVRG